MLKSELVNGVPEVKSEDLKDHTKEYLLIDVRTAEEYIGELGHIEEAELIPLGPELQAWLEAGDRNKPIIFVCRSGARSAQATVFSHYLGYKNTYNLQGGMLRWNDLKYPLAK